MIRILVLAALLAATPALAQQQQQQAAGDRIAAQIGRLVIQVEQQQDQINTLQDQLAKAHARIKELEPKPEAKK